MFLLASGVKASGQIEQALLEVSAGEMYYIRIAGSQAGGSVSAGASYMLSVTTVYSPARIDYEYDDNGRIKRKTTTEQP